MVPELGTVEEPTPPFAALQTVSSDRQPAAEWRFLTRIAFGFVCGYFVLVWVLWISGGLFGLSWFLAVGRWPITHVLHLPEHFEPSLTAANYLPSYLATLILTLSSATLSIGWAVFDRRRPSHPQGFTWLHTAVRFLLAWFMLWYGWNKVLPGQFGRFSVGAGTDYLIHEVGQLPPRDLLWAFMDGSRPYQVFTGLTEVVGGLLLLTRRTAMVGALLSTAAMINVVMLDVGYDVSVKFVAAQILLMAVVVLTPYTKRLLGALVLNETTHPFQLPPLFVRGTADRTARIVGVLFAAGIVVGALKADQSNVATNRAIPQTLLHGIWDVEAVSRNEASVPLLITDDELWRRVVFPSGGSALVVSMSNAVTRCASKIDPEAKTIDLAPLGGNSTVAASIFGVPPPMPHLSFSFSLPDGDHLLLRGTMPNGDSVMMRFRRFDHATYQLLSHKSEWFW